MIMLTRPTGQRFALNPDLILSVDGGAATVVTMVDGATVTVAESTAQVAELMTAYRTALVNGHHEPERQHLRMVRGQPSPRQVTTSNPAGDDEASDRPAGSYLVVGVGGHWYIGWPDRGEQIPDRAWLDQWLGAREAFTADLIFESTQAKTEFEQDFGPPVS